MRQKPDLIVPVHDRRQRKRYLTLRNVRNAVIIFVVLFAGITIRSEMQDKGPARYGRIYERTLPEKVEQKPVEVVQEKTSTPVADVTHADPMLIEPMVREQWLGANSAQMYEDFPPTEGGTPVSVDTSHRAVTSVQTGDTRVAIVGGTEGVAVVKQKRTRPILAGGFGR